MNPDALQPGPRRPHRVVVLCAGGELHRHTCATLLRAGVHVVGIVVCRRDTVWQRMLFVLRWMRRHGVWRTIGQIIGRLYYQARNGRWDAAQRRRLVDDAANRAELQRTGVPIIATDSYSRPDTMAAIQALDPDIFVVHTKYIVGRSVQRLARVAVIGGHPGITPDYRGAYSAFWALLRGRPDMVGWTVFLLDDGIDTGPILFQDRTPVIPGADSPETLDWKGMMCESARQAEAIKRLDAGEVLPLRRIGTVPPDSYFGVPTLFDYLRFWRVQRAVR